MDRVQMEIGRSREILYQPANIIAFTFTDKAAADIHERCRERFGDMTGLAEMYIGTIHGFCLPKALWLISAIPNPFEASGLVESARTANPTIRIVARAHNNAEVEHLQKFGADHIVLGELETARAMVNRLFNESDAGQDAFHWAQFEPGEAVGTARGKSATQRTP
jgi:hypothetical protein